MSELKKVSNKELEKSIKFMKTSLIIYYISTILFLFIGLYNMNTIIWIGFFSFLIYSITITIILSQTRIRLETREQLQDIKDMIKIQEEGDNYDK